jgi:hypothetical protein
MKTIQREIIELEAELLRLNSLVRDRRKELVRLAKCPNKTCTCRLFWQEHVEKILALQMGKIRRQLHPKRPRAAKNAKLKSRSLRKAK